MAALKRAFGVLVDVEETALDLLGACVLGDGLGALRDGVLGQFTGKEKPDSGLNLPGGDGGPLVVVGETRGLGGDSLKDVIHERVHDRHGLGRDTGIGVDLLQDLVDVNGVRFLSLLLLFLVSGSTGGLSLTRLLRALGGNFGRHDFFKALFGLNSRILTQTQFFLLYERTGLLLAR